MNLRRITILILFIVAYYSSFSQIDQNKVDSLLSIALSSTPTKKVELYNEISRMFWYEIPDSSVHYAELALGIAKTLKNDELLGDSYNSLGNSYLVHRKSIESLPYYEKALEFRRKAGVQLKVAYTLSNVGFAYQNLNKFSEAIKAFKESAEISIDINNFKNQAYMLMNVAETYDIINDSEKALEYAIKGTSIFIHTDTKEGIAYSYNFIGSLHRNLNNINLALEYFSKAYDIYLKLNDVNGLSTSANNLGIIYDELNENDKALDYYNKSLQLSIKINSKNGQSTALNNIGFLYAKIKDYPKALESYNSSLKISKEIADYPSVMNTKNNISWVYFNLGDLKQAKNYVLKALSYEERNNNLHFTAESHEILSKIYSKVGDFKNGFIHLSEFVSLKDSLFKISSNEKYMEMQVRFETERKEKEIELLMKNDEIKNLQIERQKNINVFWTISSILLIAFGVIIFYNLRSKQKINNLLSEKNQQLEESNLKLIESEQHLKELNATKDRFFSLISHDLKNPFSAVLGFSELLHYNYDNYTKEEIEELIKIIFDSSQNLYKLLDNLLQWSKSQLGSIMYKPELFPLFSIVNQEIELLKPIADKKNLKITVRIEEYLIAFADKNLIAVIIRNLLSNAIKFSNNEDRIIITAQEKDSMVEVSITDTGVGIEIDDQDKLFRLDTSFTSKGTANEKGTGLGLLLCKEFVEKNGGKIWVESKKDQGSTFVFTIPALRSTHTL